MRPTKYEELLTAEQHEAMFAKAIHCFEDEALHLADRHAWRNFIPNMAQWRTYRLVIQHWYQTIRACCLADLPKQDFEELEG